MDGFLPSTLALGSMAVVAAILTGARRISRDHAARRAAAQALALATVAQLAHFVEEAATALHVQLPALFDLPPIPWPFFVTINVGALIVWVISIPGVRAGVAGAFFAAWFLAVAGIFNAVAHPAAAIVSGSYFSGVLTAPMAGAASLHLWVRLSRATKRR